MKFPLYLWVIGLLVIMCTQTCLAIPASNYTVTSQVQLSGPKVPDEVEYIDLVGLRSDTGQTIQTLRLILQPGMFLSTWNLVWYYTQPNGNGWACHHLRDH